MNTAASALTALSVALLLAACGDSAKFPEQAAEGVNPPLPAPTKTFIPTVDIAFAKGWPEGAKPAAAPDLAVSAFATGLDHPRWLYVLPTRPCRVGRAPAFPAPIA
jgi:glucose/arabinose dehydrogenase